MLTVCREGQRGKENACGGPRKRHAIGQEGKHRGKPEDHVEIRQNAKAVHTEVDQTQRHTELVRIIHAVARAGGKLAVIPKAPAVEVEAENQRNQEDGGEEGVHENIVQTAEGLVIRIGAKTRFMGRHAHGLIEEAVNKDAQDSDGKSRLVHIVAAVHCRRPGKQRRHKKACHNAEGKGHSDAQHVERPNLPAAEGRVEKQKVADKGRQCRGKHGDVQVIADRSLGQQTVDHHADKGRPHIDEIQAVKAMGDNQKIRRKGGAVGTGTADQNDEGAGKSADARI